MGWNCVESPWSKQTVCEEVIDGGAFTFITFAFCLRVVVKEHLILVLAMNPLLIQ
jgi:hypothetical protein